MTSRCRALTLLSVISLKAVQCAREALMERYRPEHMNQPNRAVIKCPFSTTADSLQLHVLK